MKYFKYIILISLINFLWYNSFAQTSAVTISNLLAMNYIDGTPEIKKISIMFDVSDINQVSAIQVEVSEKEDFTDSLSFDLKVIHESGKHFIYYAKDNLFPINGKPKVIFFLDVRDQFKEPYNFIRLSCIDNSGLKSNTLLFNKK